MAGLKGSGRLMPGGQCSDSDRCFLKKSKISAILMLVLFIAALLYYLWVGRYSFFHSSILTAVAIICLGLVAGSHVLFEPTLERLGLGSENFFQAGKWFGALTAIGCLIIAIIGWNYETLHSFTLQKALVYLLWAGVQQYVLQNFFLRLSLMIFSAQEKEGSRERSHFKPGWESRIAASGLSASVFALFHFPSPAFVLLTFTAAFLWCLLFTMFPSFYWAWTSHFLLGLCLSICCKSGLVNDLQVGAGGFRYESYGDGVTVAAGYEEEGSPFIATVPGPDRDNPSTIRIFSPNGNLRQEWNAFPEYSFSAMIAVGDLGFGPGDEIAVVPGPGPGNPPILRIFSTRGRLWSEWSITDPDFPQSYGAWVSVAGGKIYLAPGPGPRAPQVIAEYRPDGTQVRKWELTEKEISGEISFSNGLRGILREGPDPVLLRWGSPVSTNSSVVAVSRPDGRVLRGLETLPTTYGLNLTLVDLGEGDWGIGVAPGPLKGYPAWIKVFSFSEEWVKIVDMAPWEDRESCGANLSALDVDGDGIDELIVGEGWGESRAPLVRVLTLEGDLLCRWRAF